MTETQKCASCTSRTWVVPKDREKKRAWDRAFAARTRLEVIELLGGRCANCGLTDARVLEISHKNDDGNWRSRSKWGQGFGRADHRKMLSGKMPIDDLELLCSNCHVLHTKGYI